MRKGGREKMGSERRRGEKREGGRDGWEDTEGILVIGTRH
jgi:hypothetical protein